MATEQINNVEEMVEKAVEAEEKTVKVSFPKRVWNGIKAHKVQIGIGAGVAALTGLGLGFKKILADKTGVELDIPEVGGDLGGLGGPEA